MCMTFKHNISNQHKQMSHVRSFYHRNPDCTDADRKQHMTFITLEPITNIIGWGRCGQLTRSTKRDKFTIHTNSHIHTDGQTRVNNWQSLNLNFDLIQILILMINHWSNPTDYIRYCYIFCFRTSYHLFRIIFLDWNKKLIHLITQRLEVKFLLCSRKEVDGGGRRRRLVTADTVQQFHQSVSYNIVLKINTLCAAIKL